MAMDEPREDKHLDDVEFQGVYLALVETRNLDDAILLRDKIAVHFAKKGRQSPLRDEVVLLVDRRRHSPRHSGVHSAPQAAARS